VQALAIFKEAESQLGIWTNLPARSVFYYFMGRTALLLNNLGATTVMEMMIVNRHVRDILKREGIEVARTDFGPYLTCQEMAGFSLTFVRLDKDLERWINRPCWSLGFSQGQ
jgi:dihydroxyacetone kinase